jgi:hypothetical protein
MTMPSIDFSSMSSYAWVTAAVVSATAFWAQIKKFLTATFTWFLVTASVRDEDSMEPILEYFRANGREIFKGEISYDSSLYYVKRHKKYGRIFYEWRGSGKIFLYKNWIPVFIDYNGSDDDLEGPKNGKAKKIATITSFRWAFNMEKTIFDISENKIKDNRKKGSKHFIIRLGKKETGEAISRTEHVETKRFIGYNQEDIGYEHTKDPFENLFLPANVKIGVDQITQWHQDKEWYEGKWLQWRMGALFDGPPGNGKTSVAGALAQKLDIPIFILDISSMDNDDFISAWMKIKSYAPAMALIEDIDRVDVANQDMGQGFMPFDQKLGESKGGSKKGFSFMMRLSLDCLLNCISGVEPSDGILTIATCNDSSKLDPALGVPVPGDKSSRPGRLDIVVKFENPDEVIRTKIAKRVLDGYSDSEIKDIVKDGEGESSAQFTYRVSKKARRDHLSIKSIPTTSPVQAPGDPLRDQPPLGELGLRRKSPK